MLIPQVSLPGFPAVHAGHSGQNIHGLIAVIKQQVTCLLDEGVMSHPEDSLLVCGAKLTCIMQRWGSMLYDQGREMRVHEMESEAKTYPCITKQAV